MSSFSDRIRRFYRRTGYRKAVLIHVLVAQAFALALAVIGSGLLKGRVDPHIVVLALVIPMIMVPLHSLFDLRLLFQLERSEQSLLKIAVRDSLTGAYARQHLLARAEQEVERAQRRGAPLALLVIDIDRFKQINDSFGHASGDQILREIVELGREGVRREECLARYGGDEFVVVMPETGIEGARIVAERTRSRVEGHHFRCSGREIPVTISVGVTTLSAEMHDADAMLAAADTQLYAAKMAGRNTAAG